MHATVVTTTKRAFQSCLIQRSTADVHWLPSTRLRPKCVDGTCFRGSHARAENIRLNEHAKLYRRESDGRSHHNGSFRLGGFDVPMTLNLAINFSVCEKKSALLRQDGLALSRQIRERQLPANRHDYRLRYKKFYEQFSREEREKADDTDKRHVVEHLQEAIIEKRATRRAKAEAFNWSPSAYKPYDCEKYMVGRINDEYAAVRKIFEEIQRRDKKFTPQRIFDFGSGIGSTIWAASDTWKQAIEEYYCVDKNPYMIELAERLLRAGSNEPGAKPVIPNVNFRQYMPGNMDRRYDICVSAYSLMDLATLADRAMILSNLWHRTNRYLIIIETGTKYGLQLVLEARKLLLTKGFGLRKNRRDELFDAEWGTVGSEDEGAQRSEQEGHVFSPCPHDTECPAQEQYGDDATCAFSASYNPINFMRPVQHKLKRTASMFSYVVLRKGPRNADEASDDLERNQNHRVVSPVDVKSKCVYCTLCCADGRLRQPAISLARNGPQVYSVARNAHWGDLLPLRFEDECYDKPALSPHYRSRRRSNEESTTEEETSVVNEVGNEQHSLTPNSSEQSDDGVEKQNERIAQ